MPSVPVAHVPGVPYSSHNLSHTIRMTTSPGILKPVMIDELVPGGRYRLDIGMICDTFPTQNPLFGSFEIHTDVFLCPLKNWYANYHANFPSPDLSANPDSRSFHFIEMSSNEFQNPIDLEANFQEPRTIQSELRITQLWPALSDSFLDYLGFSIGAHPYDLIRRYPGNPEAVRNSQFPAFEYSRDVSHLGVLASSDIYSRKFCGHGLLSYFDIFRCYYMNPQEQNFYIIASNLMRGFYDYSFGGGNNSGVNDEFKNNVAFFDRQGLSSFLAAFGKLESDSYRPYVIPCEKLLNWLNYVFTFTGSQGVDLLSTFSNQVSSGVFFGSPMQGFCLRTFRPDLLTSWISSNNINNVRTSSRITSQDGSITFEQIIAGQKIYDFKQHSAISSGRYKDWVRAIYRVDPDMDSDTPILMSHSRTRLNFQGIYQNSSTETVVNPDMQRNVLGGSVSVGNAQSVNDSIVFDCTQPSVLVVMNSVVPLADYDQGIDPMLIHTSFLDCYSPDYDSLGWQPLTRGMLAPATRFDPRVGFDDLRIRSPWVSDPFAVGIGYQPSWEEYRSRVNRVRGDFHDNMSNFVLLRKFPYIPARIPGSDVFDQMFTSYIFPDLYTDAWAVSNKAPFRIQYAFGYRARLPMSKYSLPKLA